MHPLGPAAVFRWPQRKDVDNKIQDSSSNLIQTGILFEIMKEDLADIQNQYILYDAIL
jgi:hypothetical protein